MKVILVATITADGYTARNSHELVNWSSQSDKGTFVKLTREMGVIVMGGHSFRTITRDLTTQGRRVIVYTRQPESFTQPNIETTQADPHDLIKQLAAEGAHGVAVCGGTQIYTMFMRADLVDELYLVTEPVLIGQGLSLFQAPITRQIELLESTIRRGHSVVNHYKVIRDNS